MHTGRDSVEGRGRSLLVVDDEDAVRAVISRTREADGYEVCQARNGRAVEMREGESLGRPGP